MKRAVRHMRPSLKPPADAQPADAQPDDTAPSLGPVSNRPGNVAPVALPLQTYVQGASGPDGRWWVSTQLQQGALALAFALPPEQVDEWLRVIGRDMRAMADQCRQANSGKNASGLIVASPADVPRFKA